jgi:hypothetical protein
VELEAIFFLTFSSQLKQFNLLKQKFSFHTHRQSLWNTQASQRTHGAFGPAVQLGWAARWAGEDGAHAEANPERVRDASGL